MLATAHFFALLFLPLWTGHALRRHWQTPTPARVTAAMAFGGAAGLIGLAQMVSRDEGVPLAQWVLPGASAAAAMLFVGARPQRRAIAFVSVMSALVLCATFTGAVHGGHYTGNPNATRERGPAVSEWHTFLTGLYRRAGS